MAGLAQRETGETEGISLCPEAGACVAALPVLLHRHDIDPDERVVIFNTASGLKYTDMMPSETPLVDPP